MEDCGVSPKVAIHPAWGTLWQLSTTREIFLFHYVDNILLISESFKFKRSSLVLVVHLDYTGMTGEYRQNRVIDYSQNASTPLTHCP